MLIVGIYIGRNGNRNGTITNTTNVDSIRYAIQQNALDAYSAELETIPECRYFIHKTGHFIQMD